MEQAGSQVRQKSSSRMDSMPRAPEAEGAEPVSLPLHRYLRPESNSPHF